MEETAEVVETGSGKFVKFKLTGTIELSDKVTLITVATHLEEMKKRAGALGAVELEISVPRVTRAKV